MPKKVKELESNPMKAKGESPNCLAHSDGKLKGRIPHWKIWQYTRKHGGKPPLKDGVQI